jgi:hypothetical protein
MRWSRELCLPLLLRFVFASCSLWGQASEARPAVAPHVDERVELLSIVFRLAGNPEYNMNTLPKYSQQIDGYFAPYKTHAAVRMAQALRAKRGVSHEFNHSFVNPAVHEHWSEFRGAEQVFKRVQGPMQRMAYGSAETMVDESLVRAAVIVYFRQAGEDVVKNRRRVIEEQRNGFVWMDELVVLLEQYERKQAQYATFASYMPQVAQFYRDLPPRLTTEMATFDAKSAHVVRLEPFANHRQDVDAGVRAITVIFDKPLDTKAGYSINYGDGGKEHYPITGQPAFAPGGERLMLPVDLKPNQTYSFVLTPRAFATTDGYPLVSYTVEFSTR